MKVLWRWVKGSTLEMGEGTLEVGEGRYFRGG